MKKLRDSDIVRIMREEYANRLRALTEKIDITLVSQGLKVRDKDDNLFTVTRVGAWGVELSFVNQDGVVQHKRVERDEFESNYMTPAEARRDNTKSGDEEKEDG